MSSNNVPIVQGIAISDGNHKYQTPYDYTSQQDDGYQHKVQYDYPPTTHNEQLRTQPVKQFQDVIWAVLFVAHLFVVGVVIVMGLSSNSGSAFAQSSSYGGVFFVTGVTGLVGVALSAAALSFMMQHAEPLVRMALIFSVLTSLAIGIVGFMLGNIWMGGLGLLSFAIGCCYAKIVWPRIPFAATNLNTALTAVRANMGLTVASFGFTVLAFAWTVLWFLGVGTALSSSNGLFVFLLFLSYYWTHQVLQNTMHVATAGVIGTWWWVPSEANSFWSPALSDSLLRATTYSFGSVCLGSLLVAIVQALRALEYHSRGNDDLQFLSCMIQCILACIEGIIEFMNRWAYIYVGLLFDDFGFITMPFTVYTSDAPIYSHTPSLRLDRYGFSYMEAGRNVIQLFESKGWSAIVADDLAENVLFMMSFAIGLGSGLVGVVIGFMDSGMFADIGFEHAALPAFVIGFLAGFLFASIIMSVVGSGVNTVVVCYAEDPAAFEMNHPQLSAEMRAAWTQAWPGLLD